MHIIQLDKYLTGLTLVTLLMMAINGCASGTLVLETNPNKAKVFLSQVGGVPQLLGETPLTLKAEELKNNVSITGPVLLEFRKDGFSSSRVYLTDILTSDIVVNQNLDAQNDGFSSLEQQDFLNDLIDRLFESQRLARVNRYDDALDKLKQLEKQSPSLSAVYELEGSIYFIKRDYKKSLDSFRLAVKTNPKRTDFLRMIARINSLLDKQKGEAKK